MQMFIKPKPGLRVLRPDTLQPLPAAGLKVVKTSYWLRRLADGEVTLGNPEPEPAKEKKQSEALDANIIATKDKLEKNKKEGSHGK